MPRRDDIAIAAVVAAITVAAGLLVHEGTEASWGIVLPGLGGLLLAWRRQWPVAVLAAVLGLTLAYELSGFPSGPVWLPLLVAFFSAHLEGHRLAAGVTLAVGWVAFTFVSPLVRGNDISVGGAAGLAGWLLVLFAAAEVVRSRRISRADAARRQAGEERLRIARELHDVLAHDISLINVQAGVALHLIDERPEQAREALAAIKHASKDALGELRSVLDALRAEGPAPRTPTAGLARLNEVVTGAAAAGLRVETAVEGEAEPLPAAVDLAAFRIVQEAVTNVIRHADTAHAAVRLRYDDDALEVEVCDEGRGGSANGHGNGLAGMSERAAALGGTLDAGPRPGGGFRVHATLPLGAGPKPPGSFAPGSGPAGALRDSLTARANTPSETSPQGEASP